MERTIKRVANRVTTVSQLMRNLGYSYTNPGSNTIRKFRTVLGKRVYHEIASHRRMTLPKSRWTKVSINEKRD